MNKKLTSEQREWILDKLKEVSLELQDGNVSWTSVNIHRFEQALNAHTTEDERYQTALEVQAEYLKELNKYSKEKSWEEGQSQSGLFMWLGEKITGG